MTRRSANQWMPATLGAVALLAASCASTPPMSPAATGPGEVAVANSVYSALNADPSYFYRHVNVHVEGGVAALSGYVWSTEAIYHARKIARSVPGVTQVVTSGLELEREGRANGVSR